LCDHLREEILRDQYKYDYHELSAKLKHKLLKIKKNKSKYSAILVIIFVIY